MTYDVRITPRASDDLEAADRDVSATIPLAVGRVAITQSEPEAQSLQRERPPSHCPDRGGIAEVSQT